MPQKNGNQSNSRSQVVSQRFVAFVAVAVVLLLAFVFIGISQASRLGAAGPQLPPAKATLLAQGDATLAAARAHPSNRPPDAPPPEEPTATFTAGIFYFDGQSKFPGFNNNDTYRGEVNGVWEFVYVGSDISNSATGVGAIRVETFSNAAGTRLVGVFDATDHSTGLDITGIKGNVLRIKSDKTSSFGFDLTTNTFVS